MLIVYELMTGRQDLYSAAFLELQDFWNLEGFIERTSS
jgi:hypothetical protein